MATPPRSAASRSVLRARNVEFFHRLSVIKAGCSDPVLARFWGMPTLPLCSVKPSPKLRLGPRH